MSFPLPTDPVPDWDSTNVSTPSSGRRANGWAPRDVPPAEQFNWFWTGLSQWMRHVRDAVSRYVNMYEAADDSALTGGSTFMLYEDDSSYAPGSQIGGGITTTAPSGIAMTERHILTAHNGANLRVIDIDSGTITDIGLSGSGTTGVVRTDGSICAIARGTDLHVYDISNANPAGWTLLFSIAHGALVNDAAIDGTHVYLVGATSGAVEARAYTHAGAAAWTYNHNATLESVCSDGVYVFLAGAASRHASAATIRAVDAVDGSDAANEGGNGVNATIGAWDATTGVFNGPGQLACTQHRLYAADTTGNLQVRSKGTSLVDHQVAFTGIDTVTVDHEYVYASNGSVMQGFDVTSGVCSWHRVYTGGNVTQIASNGVRVYLARSGTNDILRMARGNRPGFWIKGLGPYSMPRAQITPFRSM